jgi:hypothetical protein
MQYLIERRGGFAGLKASCTVDGDALDPDDRETLEQLLDSEESSARDPGADRYTYLVTRDSPSGRTTREISESAMPRTVASLVTAEI